MMRLTLPAMQNILSLTIPAVRLLENGCAIGDDTMRQALIYPGEDGYGVAECPSLPGCISQGSTRENAKESIREAIDVCVTTLKDDGLAVPPDTFQAMVVAG